MNRFDVFDVFEGFSGITMNKRKTKNNHFDGEQFLDELVAKFEDES